MKKYFIASDIHGEYDAFISGLLEAGFDSNNPKHKIILAGDSFDRGNQNKEMLNFMKSQSDRIYFIKGNHDQFLINFLKGLDDSEFNAKYNGLFETIKDLAGLTIKEAMSLSLSEIRFMILNNDNTLLDFLQKKMVDGYKLDNYIITHAGFSKNAFNDKFYVDNWANTPNFIKQIRDNKKYEHYTFVFGHWHAMRLNNEFLGYWDRTSKPFIYKNFIGIDSCSNYTERVNILVVETDTEPQPFGDSIDLDMLENF